MYIKEQTKITKEGKIVVHPTPSPLVIRDFIEQMEDRGFELFVYCIKDLESSMNDDDALDADLYGTIDFSNGYTEDDMISSLEGYLMDFPPSERVNFALRLMNTILSDAAVPEQYEDEDEDYDL
jgi:hypothetical protein